MEKKSKILIFAGTTEGRELAEFLSEREVEAEISVATEYGETLLSPGPFLKIHQGRMEEGEMEAFFREEEIGTVVDATHPYAVVVSENIREACTHTGTEYIRLLREQSTDTADCIFVEDTEGAVEYLKQTEGNVLLTTGSKELKAFTALPDFEKRLYAGCFRHRRWLQWRLPWGSWENTICMQGPFSKELNTAMLKQFDAAYLVTKDSKKRVVLRKSFSPPEKPEPKSFSSAGPKELGTEGKSFLECEASSDGALCHSGEKGDQPHRHRHGKSGKPDAGGRAGHPGGGCAHRRGTDAGGDRQLWQTEICLLPAHGDPGLRLRSSEYESGDSPLRGWAFTAEPRSSTKPLKGRRSRSIPAFPPRGLFFREASSCVRGCLFHERSRKKAEPGSEPSSGTERFLPWWVKKMASRRSAIKLSCGMDEVKIYVGERLSYPEEQITEGTPESLKGQLFDPLSVVLLVNETPEKLTTHGLSDDVFLRAKVPMTKQGIRSISLSKLALEEDSICWDMGAGTGSVSVEMARQCPRGEVWAIEKKDEAVELLEENRRKFALDNLTIVPGLAPEALKELPAPTHVFIGGSSGNLICIMEAALEKNPRRDRSSPVIALETVAEALEALKSLPVTDSDIVTAMIGESKEIGRYHMMMGQNPVYVISCTGKGEEDE